MLVTPEQIDPSEKSEGSITAYERKGPFTSEICAKVAAMAGEAPLLDHSEFDGLVAYTDGSCKPTNPGFIGWGIHGYLYKFAEETAFNEKATVIERDYYVSDHGYLKKFQLAFKFGKDVPRPVVPVQYFDFLGSSLHMGTNNQAEIIAVTKILQYALKNGIKKVSIRTDSQYTRQGLVQWCKNWQRNNWFTAEGEKVKNQMHWEAAFFAYEHLKAQGCDIQVNWVKGHNDNMGNVQADILAGIASNYSAEHVFNETEAIVPAKGYWKTDIERHPFLSFKRIYFNSNSGYNVPGTYFHADTGAADHLIGKRIPETGLAVIRLLEPVKIIEDVKQRQYDVARELNSIIMMKLDRIYDKNIYPYLIDHGRYALNPGKGNLNLNWFDKKPVNIEVGSTGLSMRAIDCFNLLEELLDSFLSHQGKTEDISKTNPVNVHDITESFYDYTDVKVKQETVKKCTLKPTFVVGFQDMTVEVEEEHNDSIKKLKIPLILGTDLLPRNNLKKIESFNPKVYLVTWKEGQQSLRYATVISCDKGIGIWSNFFADRIFFV